MASDEIFSDVFERKVYFFRIADFDELKEALPGAFQRIENLPFEEGGRYQQDIGTVSRLLGYPDTLHYPLKIRFGRTRKDNLPDIEDQGKLTSLEINEDAGLIDVCHIVIFENGIVGAEFNYDGPRINRLGRYIFEKGQGVHTAPVFLPLFDRDVADVVRSLDSVSLVRISVPPSAAELLREADENVYSAIEFSRKAGAEKSVELKLSADPKRSKLKDLALNIVKIFKESPHEKERINIAQIEGYLGGAHLARPIDLLEDKLVYFKMFPRSHRRSRSIKVNEAYENIISCYNQNRSEIEGAATLK